MDPDAPWQCSQNAAARKAVETTDAAWPTMVAEVLWRRRQNVFVRMA
jgi:transposase